MAVGHGHHHTPDRMGPRVTETVDRVLKAVEGTDPSPAVAHACAFHAKVLEHNRALGRASTAGIMVTTLGTDTPNVFRDCVVPHLSDFSPSNGQDPVTPLLTSGVELVRLGVANLLLVSAALHTRNVAERLPAAFIAELATICAKAMDNLSASLRTDGEVNPKPALFGPDGSVL